MRAVRTVRAAAKEDQTKLVQARVPLAVHTWIKGEAKERGLSIASWLRMHLIELEKEPKK